MYSRETIVQILSHQAVLSESPSARWRMGLARNGQHMYE
jgi:hypothetical protein